MAKLRGRRRHHEDTTPWSFQLPTELTSKVDLLLLDPMTGKVRYGSRTQLVETLLRNWLSSQIGEGKQAETFHPDPSRYAGNRGEETGEN